MAVKTECYLLNEKNDNIMNNQTSTYQGIKKLTLLLCLAAFPILAFGQATDLESVVAEAQKAGIEQSTLDEIRSKARQGGLADEDIAELVRPAVDLAQQGLPADIIFSKVMEGLSKNVPANRISAVLQKIKGATEQSEPVVDRWMNASNAGDQIPSGSDMSEEEFRSEMISSVSKGLMSGVPEGEISALLDEVTSTGALAQSSPRSVATAVRVFPELPTTAENPEKSRSFIIRSLKSGFNSSELQKLPGAMTVAQRRSQLPAASVIEGVAQQLRSGVPAKQILKNLFNGNIGGGPPGSIPKGLDNKPNQGGGGNG